MKKYTFTKKIDTRSGFGAGLAELGRTNENVVALCADLIGSLKMDEFIKENPEEVRASLGWLFYSFKGLMTAVLLSLIALIIAGVFMSSADSGYKSGVKFMERLQKGSGA